MFCIKNFLLPSANCFCVASSFFVKQGIISRCNGKRFRDFETAFAFFFVLRRHKENGESIHL